MAIRIPNSADPNQDREADICNAWNMMFQHAKAAKAQFVKDAMLADRYYKGPHKFLFEQADMKKGFAVTINKVYELVSIFGPMIYHQNPKRNVRPRPNGNPAIALVQTEYLNYTPGETGLKRNAKRAIDDALIHGRGAMITGFDPRSRMVVSRAVDSRDIYIDPEADTWYGANFIMRIRRRRPAWKVANAYGHQVVRRILDGLSSRGRTPASAAESVLFESEWSDRSEREKEASYAYDAQRITYVEVWSKMGLGIRGKRSDEFWAGGDSPDNLLLVYEPFSKVVMHVGEWPIPFWADEPAYSWPFSFYDPAENADNTWPISLIKPALGEQEWLDWGWAYVLQILKKTSRIVGAAQKEIAEGLQTALEGYKSAVIAKIDDMDPNWDIKKMVQFLDIPQPAPALVAILEKVEQLFEKRTGLYEVLYGQSKSSYRSATEAEIKGQYSRLRIDDVIDKAEDWQSDVARKEAIAARLKVEPQDLVPIVGPKLAQAWGYYRPGTLEEAMREYQYEIVAGSTRKKTPEQEMLLAGEVYEKLGPLMLMVGDLEGYNRVQYDWLKTLGVNRPERHTLRALPPPPEKEGGSKTPKKAAKK